MQLHQKLLPRGFANGEAYCRLLVNRMNTEFNFPTTILYSIEVTFHKSGCVNRHNFHYYSDSNKHLHKTTSQFRWLLIIRAGSLDCYLIKLYFLHGDVTDANFLEFSGNNFQKQLHHVPQNIVNTMQFRLDGAPPHYVVNVRNGFNMDWTKRLRTLASYIA